MIMIMTIIMMMMMIILIMIMIIMIILIVTITNNDNTIHNNDDMQIMQAAVTYGRHLLRERKLLEYDIMHEVIQAIYIAFHIYVYIYI